MLGLGTNIPDAAGLPTMDADGKIPKDLGKKYGKMILDADGFAQVGVGVWGGGGHRCVCGVCVWGGGALRVSVGSAVDVVWVGWFGFGKHGGFLLWGGDLHCGTAQGCLRLMRQGQNATTQHTSRRAWSPS